MRPVSLLTAALVTAALYLLVFEREALVAFAQGDATKAEDASIEPEPERRVSVVALRSTAQQIDSVVVVRGRTEAARQVDVRSETAGLIISQPIRKGATVEEGQLLCSIAPGAQAASLAEAEARLAEAEINERSVTSLAASGAANETRVASVRAALQSAQAGVEAAQREVDRLTITAPFSGLLESDTAEIGQLLQTGGLCATIIQLDPVKLVGFVPETEVDRVKLGAIGQAQLTSGQEVIGRVTFISRSADSETRTFRVELEAPNPEQTIRDGQTAEIQIAAEGRVAHLLPQSALTLDDAGTMGVRVVDDAQITRFRPVEILQDNPRGIFVSGLGETADVIVVGQEFVTEGVPVDPTFREPSE